MVGKNNKRLLDQKANKRFTKWSLRRLNIGVVSVAIASGFVMAGGLEIASIAKATTEMQAHTMGSQTTAMETSGTARAEGNDEAVTSTMETTDTAQAAPVSTMPNAKQDEKAIAPVRTVRAATTGTMADQYEPETQNIKVLQGHTPDKADAEDAVVNIGELPPTTQYKWVETNTWTAGEQAGFIEITYPDGSSETVGLTVVVDAGEAGKHPLKASVSEVGLNTDVDPKIGIQNLDALPEGVTVAWEEKIDTTKAGTKEGHVIVTYKDGSRARLTVTVNVKDDDANIYTPQGHKVIVEQNGVILPELAIANTDDLPDDAQYSWKDVIDTSKPGDFKGTVVVTYSDKTKDEVTVDIQVNAAKPATLADKYTPKPEPVSVKQHEKVAADKLIGNKNELPGETKYTFEKEPDTKNPGAVKVKVIVKYSDGSTDTVNSQVLVIPGDAEAYEPEGQDITVQQGETAKPENGIKNKDRLPRETKYKFEGDVETDTPGTKQATIVVTFPDGSEKKVTVNVKVNKKLTLAEQHNPTAKPISGKQGELVDPREGIRTPSALPSGTRFEYATKPDTTTVDYSLVTIKVLYSDGSVDTVITMYTVTPNPDFKVKPEGQDLEIMQGDAIKPEDAIKNKDKLPKDVTYTFENPVDVNQPGEHQATIIVANKTGYNEKVTVKVTVNKKDMLADQYDPQGKNLVVKLGEKPEAKTAITNLKDLPDDTTVKWETPLQTATPGKKSVNVVVKYADGSQDIVTIELEARESDADAFPPLGKDLTVKKGEQPEAKSAIENHLILPENTKYTWKKAPDTNQFGHQRATVLVSYPDGSEEEVTVSVTVLGSLAEEFDPTGKAITTHTNEKPEAESAIENAGDLPNGTTYEWVDGLDTTMPGKKAAKVLVKYRDGSSETVDVEVTVQAWDKDTHKVVQHDLTVKKGEAPVAMDAVLNHDELPEKTKYSWGAAVDTSKPGNQKAEVVVTYPDGSEFKFEVLVRVIDDQNDKKTQAEENEPKGKNLTVNVGDQPEAKSAIENADQLPQGTTFAWKETPDTTKPGDKKATVIVTYADQSTDMVEVTVRVAGTQADEFDPQGKDLVVQVGDKVDAKDAIASQLPAGTTFKWENAVDTMTPGEVMATVIVTYPDQSMDKVSVKVTVKQQMTMADANEPKGKDLVVTVGDQPAAKSAIENADQLPKDATFAWATVPDTTKPGTQMVKVIVTYADKSMDEVTVTVTVNKKQTVADQQNPQGQKITVKQGEIVNAKDGIVAVDQLPANTTIKWKALIDTTKPGMYTGTIVLTYVDGSMDEVMVDVEVVKSTTMADEHTPMPQKITVNQGEMANAEAGIQNLKDLPNGTKVTWSAAVDTTKPGIYQADVVVMYADGSEDTVEVTVEVVAKAEPDKPIDPEQPDKPIDP
ncbi:MAG: Rib/alpha-like domain-containing protein, partial [Aerococcus sp.]|nr:Rib/alpha-like domain-containing protein [Aerococcus sp.]